MDDKKRKRAKEPYLKPVLKSHGKISAAIKSLGSEQAPTAPPPTV